MKCERCNIEMEPGIAVPSSPENALCDPGNIRVSWPFDFQDVLKCPSCGRSLSAEEIERMRNTDA